MNHPPNNDNDNANNDAGAPGIAAAAVADDQDADADADDAICMEAMTLLQNRLNFPSRLRDRTMVQFAQQFINNVKEDIHKMLTDTRTEEMGYDGLDSERDTEEEVAIAIRSCPEVLTQRDERFGFYPISCLTCMMRRHNRNEDRKIVRNVKAISFVHLFVQLAIEFNSFPNEERGGLLIEYEGDRTGICGLVVSSHSSCDEEYQQHVDSTFLAVLIRLRRSGYLVENDIQQYNLVHKICLQQQFSVQRFRFLIEWDPSALLQPNAYNELPLHLVADDLRSFRVVLDCLFRYYPRWRGTHALFHNGFNDTPFALACKLFTHTKVMVVVEEILVRYTTNEFVDYHNALIMSAIDDNISLDGLYFFMRRQPDSMLSMLRHRNNNNHNHIVNRNGNDPGIDSTVSDDNTGTEDSSSRHNKNNHSTGDNNNNDHGSNNNHSTVAVLRRRTGKRKRN